MKTLETERLILRAWTFADVEDLYEYAKNPNIGPNAGWKPHESREESAAILSMFIDHGDVWAIEYKENRKVIGSVGLHGDGKREGVHARMVGYVLSQEYWGMGLMTEAVRRVIRYAFEELDLDILSVYHYPHNSRSRRVIEKCGFKYEGMLRKASKIYDGTVMDYMCYSITKEEFVSRNGGNPWTEIELADYEKHMGAEDVLQMQTLSRIMSEQLADAHGCVTVLGAAGGNGLEHVNPAQIEKVYAVDINAGYLAACRSRFDSLGETLVTVRCDLTNECVVLPETNLLIGDLIVEYIGAQRFAQIAKTCCGSGAVSCVIQKNNGAAFVSASETADKLKPLEALHRDVGERELAHAMEREGFRVLMRKTYPLPNAKEFIRLDFCKTEPA